MAKGEVLFTESKRESETNYAVIGTRPIRPDGYEKVTGQAKYGADIQLPGLLHGKVLRSPHPHARILAIDTAQAETLPGVFAVVTGADLAELSGNKIANLGESNIGVKHMSAIVLAKDRAVYKGQAVAAVAAATPHIAEAALALIDVKYEPLPVIGDLTEAVQPGAQPILDDINSVTDPALVGLARGLMGAGEGAVGARTNLAGHVRHARGDIDKGFSQADVIVEREFDTQMVHQGYIEPQNATAQVTADGQITIWTSTQGAFSVRDQTAEVLQIPVGRIKVVPLEIGGGFGGKTTIYLEPVAALLAKRSGRPVKLVMNRAEVFQATGPGSGTKIRCRLGATKDGKLVAAELRMAYDAGAFPGSPVGAACLTGLSPYTVPNLRIDGFDVLTNKPRVQAYRAPGATPVAFAVETLLDELAVRLRLDPVELRLKNAVKAGDRMTNDVQFNRIGFVELLEAVKASDHYRSPKPKGPHAGRGFGAGFWMNGGGRSSVHLTFNTDGTVNLIEGSTDIGGSRASMAMIVAEELGLAFEDVKPQVVDTASVGETGVTGGSRVTYSTGVACYRAALDAREELIKRAARHFEVEPGLVRYEAGEFVTGEGESRKAIATKALIQRLGRTGGPFTARGVSGGLKMAAGFGANLVDVEVDPETGKVQYTRFTVFQDVGKAIHPSYAEGQLQGGVVQGI
ncbi:MAG TPA: xanthine dehydrogenase family protein molybdopterin-binding subunit, partial [Limnochordia bacterium]|nr:xanthine dehydrogenase family protein molybdopterin-binding subunit [Limnochordia bacterium]